MQSPSTPCSAAALPKRVKKTGVLPEINPIVDLYNAVSILYAVPVGGENLDAYVGEPCLTVADGTESFETMANGEPAEESPTVGEVIWRDDVGVTCRRWNWRQCTRTRVDGACNRLWFVIEALPEMPQEALQAAGNELVNGLKQMMPQCVVSVEAIR